MLWLASRGLGWLNTGLHYIPKCPEVCLSTCGLHLAILNDHNLVIFSKKFTLTGGIYYTWIPQTFYFFIYLSSYLRALNISQYHFESYDQLKDTLRKEFKIEEDIQIKILGDNGGELELSGATWEQLKASGTTQVQLAVEVRKGDMDEDEGEVSNYEEDDFEMPMSEKTMLQPISQDKVVEILSTIRYVCQIKKIKKEDILKFLLHGDDRQK